MTKDYAIELLKHCMAESRCVDYAYGNCGRCNQRIAQDMAIESLKTEAIPVEWLKKEIKRFGDNKVYEIAGSLLLSYWNAEQRKEDDRDN